jgi:hypothetical protein
MDVELHAPPRIRHREVDVQDATSARADQPRLVHHGHALGPQRLCEHDLRVGILRGVAAQRHQRPTEHT